jgi:DoxX-like family
MSAAPSLFLLVDGAMKLAKPAVVVEATVRLGYPESVIPYLGIVLIACTAIYLVPATYVRVGDGVFPVIFPILLGALLWGGLVLRNLRLAALLPLESHARPEGSQQKCDS